jgi:hypothetical protein
MFKRLRGYLREASDAGLINNCDPTSSTRAIIGATDWVFYWLHRIEHTDVARHRGCGLGHAPARTLQRHRRLHARSLEVTPDQDRAGQGFDREEQHRLKQEAFYKAGTRVFNKKGFNGASLDEIAEHLNVSKGAFYYHIRNKEDLLYACYERSIAITRRIHARALSADNSGTGENR